MTAFEFSVAMILLAFSLGFSAGRGYAYRERAVHKDESTAYITHHDSTLEKMGEILITPRQSKPAHRCRSSFRYWF